MDTHPGTSTRQRMPDQSNVIPFPIVAIGASAGGYPALAALLKHLPPSPGMALVIVLHLPPDRRTNADSVLQGDTTLPVVLVSYPMPVLPNQVYVIPPDRTLKIEDGHFVPDALESKPGDPITISQFFRTLALAHKERAVAVVLSGMGADGTAGLAYIKEMGGVTIAQLPEDATEEGMPNAAIAFGMTDFVMTAAQISDKLIELHRINEAIREHAATGNSTVEVAADVRPDPHHTVRAILALLHARTGHDFQQYRLPMLVRRMERRLQVNGLADLSAYLQLLQHDTNGATALMKEFLIGVTHFFRDPDAFTSLEHRVLPQLFRDRQSNDEVRAWVAACSTGEEAYSMAMLLESQNTDMALRPKVQVFGADST